ncbi:MAG: hypothetical protein E7375_00310 [Clostridiales bacterium]|nr:hypothetical protein [Clostridiales bacterium]
MENTYNDQLLPENFEEMAKAYAKALKNKGFVFIRLEEEEFNLLIGEILILLEKMQACLKKLCKKINSAELSSKIVYSEKMLQEKFGKKKPHKFVCVENENNAFLSLIAIQNTLTIKLMLLSIKSGEFEICNSIITAISSIFAESFSCEGFILDIN